MELDLDEWELKQVKSKATVRLREQESKGAEKPSKRRKYELITEKWGEEEPQEGAGTNPGNVPSAPPPPKPGGSKTNKGNLRNYFQKSGEGGPPKPSPYTEHLRVGVGDPLNQGGPQTGSEEESIARVSTMEGGCKMVENKCVLHGDNVRKIKVKSTKWEWISKRKCYGNVRRSTTRFVCMTGVNYARESKNSTTLTKSAKTQSHADLGEASNYNHQDSGVSVKLSSDNRLEGCE